MFFQLKDSTRTPQDLPSKGSSPLASVSGFGASSRRLIHPPAISACLSSTAWLHCPQHLTTLLSTSGSGSTSGSFILNFWLSLSCTEELRSFPASSQRISHITLPVSVQTTLPRLHVPRSGTERRKSCLQTPAWFSRIVLGNSDARFQINGVPNVFPIEQPLAHLRKARLCPPYSSIFNPRPVPTAWTPSAFGQLIIHCHKGFPITKREGYGKPLQFGL